MSTATPASPVHAARRGSACRGAGRGAARAPRPPRAGEGGSDGEAQERLAPVRVEARRACARGPRATAASAAARGSAAAPEAHVGDRAAREVERVAARVGHDLHHRRRQHLVDATQRQRERRDRRASGRRSERARPPRRCPAGSSIGSSPCTLTTISASIAARGLGEPVGAGRRGRARSSPPRRRSRARPPRSARRRSRRPPGPTVWPRAHARGPARSWSCRGCPREASPGGVLRRNARG